MKKYNLSSISSTEIDAVSGGILDVSLAGGIVYLSWMGNGAVGSTALASGALLLQAPIVHIVGAGIALAAVTAYLIHENK